MYVRTSCIVHCMCVHLCMEYMCIGTCAYLVCLSIHMCVSMTPCVCPCVCACVCTYPLQTSVHTHVRMYIHTTLHMLLHVHINVCSLTMSTYVHATGSISTYTHLISWNDTQLPRLIGYESVNYFVNSLY